MRYAAPLLALPALVPALLLAGCGTTGGAPSAPTGVPVDPTSSSPAQPGDESGDRSPARPTGRLGAVDAYREWLGALAAHDAVLACSRHAPELTIALRDEAILRDRAESGDPCAAFVALLWEDPARETDPRGIEVTRETGEVAVLAVDLPDADRTVDLVRRDGRWLVLGESPRAEPGPESGTANGDPRRWLDAWCEVSPGDTVAAATALMGPPSGVYTIANGGEPQVWWAQDQYDFRAYLDADPPTGRVLDLVVDKDALSAADRARVPCPELR